MTVTPPVPVEVPERLKEECDRPVKLPDRAVTVAEVGPSWKKDREALVECRKSKQALVDSVEIVEKTNIDAYNEAIKAFE